MMFFPLDKDNVNPKHCYYCDQVYSPKQIKLINKRLKKYIKPAPSNAAEGATGVVKTSTVFGIKWDDAKQDLAELLKRILYINNIGFGYNLYPSLNHILYNVYEKNQQYDWHMDATLNPYTDSKLTCLLNVSETSYKGGEFQIFNGQVTPVSKLNTPGSLCVFSSFMLHRVLPITHGIRKSITLILEGPKFI